jgi:hypothetical protein
MTPSQLAAAVEARSRDRIMPRADKATINPAVAMSFEETILGRMIADHVITHGQIRLHTSPGEYAGGLIYGGEMVIDRYLVRTSRPMSEDVD